MYMYKLHNNTNKKRQKQKFQKIENIPIKIIEILHFRIINNHRIQLYRNEEKEDKK